MTSGQDPSTWDWEVETAENPPDEDEPSEIVSSPFTGL